MFGVCISSPKAIFSRFASQGALNMTMLLTKQTRQEEVLLWIYSVFCGETPKIILLWTKVRCTVPDFHMQETNIYMYQNEPAPDRPGSLVFPADVTADWRSKIHSEVNSVLISIKIYSNDTKPLCFTVQESNSRKGRKNIANGHVNHQISTIKSIVHLLTINLKTWFYKQQASGGSYVSVRHLKEEEKLIRTWWF